MHSLARALCRDLSEEMRSHKDLAKDAVPHFAKAKKFYNNVAAELVAHGHTLDMFTCALDQVRCGSSISCSARAARHAGRDGCRCPAPLPVCVLCVCVCSPVCICVLLHLLLVVVFCVGCVSGGVCSPVCFCVPIWCSIISPQASWLPPFLFLCCFTQVGLAEMKGMVLSTGGMALQTDTFHNKVFWDSLKRLFQKETDEGFIGCSSNGVLEVWSCFFGPCSYTTWVAWQRHTLSGVQDAVSVKWNQ